VADSTTPAIRRVDWLAVSLAMAVALMAATLSVLRFTGYNSGMFDIGNMSQAIWSVTQGRPLEFTWQDGSVSRLAWHAEVIYLALAGAYAIAPDPRTLLVFQALWFAVGALPAHRMASRRFRNPWHVRTLMLVYLLYPTAHTAVLFDFHGDTLAIPFLMFALDALDRKDGWQYAIWLGLAMLCKIYVAVPVCVLGVVVYLKGHRRLGAVAVILAMVWLSVLVLVIRPAFSPSPQSALSARPQSYWKHYFTEPGGARLLDSLSARAATGLLVLMPVLVFGRHAWHWLLPGMATIAPALLSVGVGASYDYRFHHYALSVPFLVMSVMVGIDEHRRRQSDSDPQVLRKCILFQGALSVLLFVLLVDMPLNPRFWLSTDEGWGISDTKYGQTPRDRLKDGWLSTVVPPDAPIATADLLAPHLINRRTIYQVRYTGPEEAQHRLFLEHLEEVDYVVVDALHDKTVAVAGGHIVGGVLHYLPAIVDVLNHPGFELQATRDGLLLFGRPAAMATGLSQSLDLTERVQERELVAEFGGAVGLLEASAQRLGDCRFRLRFAWVATTDLADHPQLMAVSRMVGLEDGRYPHLPTMAYSTQEWTPGAVVVEEIDIALPSSVPPGAYSLATGWYDTSLLVSRYTDHRSRVGDEHQLLTLDCVR